MNFREQISDIVISIAGNVKIKNFFQKSFIADRVNGVLNARSPVDFNHQPVKLLQAYNIGNYFYIALNTLLIINNN